MKVLKYKRGQIWWYKMSNSYDGSIQGKTRPYLIISNDVANSNAKVMLGIPFTTSIKKYIPTHLTLEFNDCENTLLAEQITSLNVEKITSYIGELDEEAMNKVEQCVRIAIGLDSCFVGIIKHHLSNQPAEEKVNDEGVYKLTEKGKSFMNEVKEAGLLENKKRGAKLKYTEDFKRDYIKEYNDSGVEGCMKKFGDKDAKSVRNKLYYFKNSLKEVVL